MDTQDPSRAESASPAGASAPGGEARPEGGRLRDFPLPELLWQFHSEGRSGCLRLRKGALEKTLWLAAGAPVFARSNEAGDRLTDRLLVRGLLTRAQFDQAQDLLARTSGKRIGEVLLENGLIRERELNEALGEQILRMVESMFSWNEGSWQFEPGPCTDRVVLDRSLAAILMSAARHRIPLRRLWDAIGDHHQLPRLAYEHRTDDGRAELTATLMLEPSESAWLARLDGSRTLAELLDDFEVDEHELLALLFTLRLLGHLQLELGGAPALAFQR
ncbi:DUF4388 domain-containing protein [Nannocystis bainbridge]|uniref:DUF4388 domain-containing protein n=1 Tax=Nannocystis bainbridge TaxID=2995303 RepID=A0ABT5E0W0_9BACT|nr:DUF4388 domain-containing protein [Nannocystis bainbridge]MDC0719479.1 DUF4388 domain-containing protein [Nannocystis bainbridge]